MNLRNSALILPSNRSRVMICMGSQGAAMAEKKDVRQGTLALMILKTLESMGSLHAYGIARRIEQISGDALSVQYGTIYPLLLKLEQEGHVASEWTSSENNRRAKYYRLTRAGRTQLEKESSEWQETTAVVARFLSLGKEHA
jgi:transcriptional regulator